MLPVEAQMTLRAPSSSAFATASTIPRSLNEPVGFWPSILRWRFADADGGSPSRRAWTSGVAPSPSETTGVASADGQELAVALDERAAGRERGRHRAQSPTG